MNVQAFVATDIEEPDGSIRRCSRCGEHGYSYLIFQDLVGNPIICERCVARALGLQAGIPLKPQVAEQIAVLAKPRSERPGLLSSFFGRKK